MASSLDLLITIARTHAHLVEAGLGRLPITSLITPIHRIIRHRSPARTRTWWKLASGTNVWKMAPTTDCSFQRKRIEPPLTLQKVPCAAPPLAFLAGSDVERLPTAGAVCVRGRGFCVCVCACGGARVCCSLA